MTTEAAFVARWCAVQKVEIVDEVYRVRDDEPTPRVGSALHRTKPDLLVIPVAELMLARSPGRPRPRKEWNAVHPGDWISRHSAYAGSVPNECCPTDSLLVVPADLRLW